MAKIESITFRSRSIEYVRGNSLTQEATQSDFTPHQITKPSHDLRIPDHVNYSLKRARLAEIIEENA